MSTQIAVAAAVAGIGAYAWYRSTSSAISDKPVFSSFGFHTLRLHSTELINHNTKKLRFELPGDPTKPSGLSLTSALLTIAFPNGRWLPVLRPYTPTNDLSMHQSKIYLTTPNQGN
jgi:cytochrome-b5 reductase